MVKSSTIYRTLVLLFLLAPMGLRAQATDVELSIEPDPGARIDQYWPSLFVLDGRLYVTWGELRTPNPGQLSETWYTLARWHPTGNPIVEVVSTLKVDSIVPGPGTSIKRLRGGSSERPLSFNGIFAAGSGLWRGDIMSPGNDTVFSSLYSLYFPDANGWKRVTIDDRKDKRDVYIVQKGYGYDPARREVICAWTVGSATTGTVTSVDITGNVQWTAENIPLMGARVSLIPIAERDFLTIIDSTAIRYQNGVPQDTFQVGPYHGNAYYQRLLGDHFLRGYLTPDSTHHVLQSYSFDGSVQRTLDLNWVGVESMYSVAQEPTSRLLGIVSTGPKGVNATIVEEDFSPLIPLMKMSQGSDTSYSPVATFRQDTFFVAWQNMRGGHADIYGASYRYQETDTIVGVPSTPDLTMDIGSIFPNPASHTVRVALTLPFSSGVDIEIIDATGRVAYRDGGRILTEGSQMLDIPLDGMVAGAYTVFVRAGELRASGKLILVR